MKKTIFCLWATVTVLLFAQTTNAQITLEHTFEGDVYFAGQSFSVADLIGGDAGVFVCQKGNNINLYNTDYSLYKSIDIIPPTGYYVYNIHCVTKKLFNDDNKIEFMVWLFPADGMGRKFVLYNEDATLLKDFGPNSDNFWIYKVNEQYKLVMWKYDEDWHRTTEIYSLPGTISNAVPQMGNNIFQSPYPNPANSTITLPYQLNQGEISTMRIYNLNGQLIESKQIGAEFDKILLNVSNYKKGLYLYEVNGVSNRFIVR